MKRSVLLIALLLSVIPASAAPQSYGIISTLDGKAFFDCRIMHIYPDGVSFTHRDGAAKIAFKDLPYNLRNEFHYDAKAEAEYQKQQAALRKAEQERQKQQEIVMQERLMEAKMAEASYLADARRIASTPAPMSLAQPGEQLNQTPSWVGTPITGPAVGGRGYSSGSYSRFGFPFGYYGSGYGYPLGGAYYGVSYGYPSCGGYSYGYPYYGGYSYGSYSRTTAAIRMAATRTTAVLMEGGMASRVLGNGMWVTASTSASALGLLATIIIETMLRLSEAINAGI